MHLKIGSVVYPLSGHDRGVAFAVVGFANNSVLIANGRQRKIEKPKAKNPKHLQITAETLEQNRLLTNKLLHEALRPHNAQQSDTRGNILV